MGNKTNIIEINGQRYDATTGALLGGGKPVRHVDGVKATTHKTATPAAAPRQITVKTPAGAQSAAKKTTLHDVHRAKPAAAKSHQPQSAKTLRRDTVKKPVIAPKSNIKARSHKAAVSTQPKAEISPKLSIQTIDEQRLHRAKKVTKSKQVSRFSTVIPATPGQFIAPSVAAQPVAQPISPAAPMVARQARPVDSLFERALDQATSHRQPPLKKAKKNRSASRKIMSISGVAFAVLLLVGIVGYQHKSNLTVLRASAKAGFSASLPTTQPAGFSIANFEYDAGRVAINYHSNSADNRAFTITEKPSKWDSSTLRDVFVEPLDSNYQTVEAAGRILYLYGNGNATWVDQGTQYIVHGQNSLSTKQLVNLASSL